MSDGSSIHSSEPEESFVPPPPMTPEMAAALIASAFPKVDTTAVRHIGGHWLFGNFSPRP